MMTTLDSQRSEPLIPGCSQAKAGFDSTRKGDSLMKEIPERDRGKKMIFNCVLWFSHNPKPIPVFSQPVLYTPQLCYFNSKPYFTRGEGICSTFIGVKQESKKKKEKQ